MNRTSAALYATACLQYETHEWNNIRESIGKQRSHYYYLWDVSRAVCAMMTPAEYTAFALAPVGDLNERFDAMEAKLLELHSVAPRQEEEATA